MRIPNELQPVAANAEIEAERLLDRYPSADPRRPEPAEAIVDVRTQAHQALPPGTGDSPAATLRRRPKQSEAETDRRRGERRQHSQPVLLDTRSTRGRRRKGANGGIDTEV